MLWKEKKFVEFRVPWSKNKFLSQVNWQQFSFFNEPKNFNPVARMAVYIPPSIIYTGGKVKICSSDHRGIDNALIKLSTNG